MTTVTGRKRVIILGATGSIGMNALDVIGAHPDRFQLVAASAHSKRGALRSLGAKNGVSDLCLSGSLDSGFPYSGEGGLIELVRSVEADIVINAIAGRAGLESSIASLESGKDLALANKETMVCAGHLARKAAESAGKAILPVDSEHSAVFHLIGALGAERIDEIVLTASGGPFRDRPLDDFPSITVEEALKHPNWSMGRKITIDSATMANKGLEVIEAKELFGISAEKIKVTVHRESRVHSLVRTVDGSLYAQVSLPDMRVPIQNALSYPETIPCPFGRLELDGERFSFEKPDLERFPLLGMAFTATKRSGSYPLAFNAANEVAVEAFILGRIGFTDIARVVSDCLQGDWSVRAESLPEIDAMDRRARAQATEAIEKRGRE